MLSQGGLEASRAGGCRKTDTRERESIRKLRCAASITTLSVSVPKKSRRTWRSAPENSAPTNARTHAAASALDALLDAGFAGACVAADALAERDSLAALGPVLELLERRDAPLLVHPGPSPRTLSTVAAAGMPPWWPALTRYVCGMHAAWHAFAAVGRPAHPRLRVCFAMLAGLAPLHRERLAARGGRHGGDVRIFLDTSSYGSRAMDAVIREVGVDALVHGSDIPVIAGAEADLGRAVSVAVRERNPARLLSTADQEVAV